MMNKLDLSITSDESGGVLVRLSAGFDSANRQAGIDLHAKMAAFVRDLGHGPMDFGWPRLLLPKK